VESKWGAVEARFWEHYDALPLTVTDEMGFPVATKTVGWFKTLKAVHQPETCAGQDCVLHNPSSHDMLDRPMVWRQDTGVMERTCEHGVGHPDPDHMSYVKSLTPEHDCELVEGYKRNCGYPHLEWQGVHGCDRCC
jgi:hypothetical protein